MSDPPTRTRPTARRRRFTLLAVIGLVIAALWWLPDWPFWSRIATFPYDESTMAIEWYEPLEPVPGRFDSPLPTAGAASLGFDPVRLTRAAEWADQKNSSAFLVLRRGQIALERYWRSGSRDRATVSQSLAKTLIALLIGTAIERGEIGSLDDPIGRYVAEWRDTTKGSVTLAQLLRMSSGLENDDSRNSPFSAIANMHLGSDLLPTILAIERDREPGMDWEYNNFNSQLVGLALERATGQRYADLLSQRIWQPVGARDAVLWLDRDGGNAKVYGGLLATARDWARIGELVRHRGAVDGQTVVGSNWFDELERPSPHRATYGLHIWLHAADTDHGTPAFVYLDGKSKQRVFVIRDHELVIVRTGENARGWSEAEIVGLVVGALRN
ncbi:MAG: beta-lactamase family protein [bacterium]|nr:beta-lactamase family protein [bacterium]